MSIFLRQNGLGEGILGVDRSLKQSTRMTLMALICGVLRFALPWLRSCNGGNLDHCPMNLSRYSQTCLTYTMSEDFVAKFEEVMSDEPQSLTREEQYKLS